jgi:hypothetical protein
MKGILMLPQIIIENHTIRDVIADEPVLVVDYDTSQRGTTATWSDNGNEIGACVYIVQPDGTKVSVEGEFIDYDALCDAADKLAELGKPEKDEDASITTDNVLRTALQLNNTLAGIQRHAAA